jgi:hypothetical protein
MIPVLIIGTNLVYGDSTVCQIDNALAAPKAIGWDTVTKLAKYTDSANKTHAGVVTLTRKHDSGEKINLYFDFGRDYNGITKAEFIVFPVFGGKHRVIGVGYTLLNGEKLLTQLIGAYDAACLSL